MVKMTNRPEQPTMSETADLANGRLADDLLTGAAEIADFLGRPERQAFHMLEKKQVPAFKVGGRWPRERGHCALITRKSKPISTRSRAVHRHRNCDGDESKRQTTFRAEHFNRSIGRGRKRI